MTISNFFVPNRQTVQDISRTNPGVVTTTQSHGYHDGLIVRFYFPGNFGMPEVANQIYQIVVLSPTTFAVNTDTSNFIAFNGSEQSQTPQVIPVGEISSTLKEAVINNGNIVPETTFIT